MLQLYRLAGGQPDVLTVQSWYTQPAQYLPDTELYSFMRLIVDFAAETNLLYS